MPFAFLIIGVVLVVAGVRDKTSELFSLLKQDFSGKTSYEVWALSILVIGGLGYIKSLQGLSRAFMALVLIVLFVSNGGFFQQFNSEILSPSASSTGATTQQPSTTSVTAGAIQAAITTIGGLIP
jgi:hypothetical protein